MQSDCDFCNELRRAVRRAIKKECPDAKFASQDYQRLEEAGLRGLATRFVAVLAEADDGCADD